MGKIPKSQSIDVQNLGKSQFSKMDLMWNNGIQHGGQSKVSIKITYIPYARDLKFLKDECENMNTPVEWNIHKNLPPQKDVKHLTIKNHLEHTR
jgi:hypothetical protein